MKNLSYKLDSFSYSDKDVLKDKCIFLYNWFVVIRIKDNNLVNYNYFLMD